MKRYLLVTLALAAALFPFTQSGAEETSEFTEDEVARAALRLAELRYFNHPHTVLPADGISGILNSDIFDEPLAYDALFASDADFAPLRKADALLTAASAPLHAESLSFESASGMLAVGASYALTGMASGAVVRVRFQGLTDGCAVFVPLTVWDGATLGSIFDDRYDFRSERCALTIGSKNYLAAVSVFPGDIDPKTAMPTICRLYFDGSAPKLGNLSGIGYAP